MVTEIIQIGNSRGIRIPKPILEQCGLSGSVDLQVDGERLILSRSKVPRSGWEEAFRSAGPSGDDELLLEEIVPNAFDADEWRW